MKTTRIYFIVLATGLAASLGQGCKYPSSLLPSSNEKTKSAAASQGFGKLPALPAPETTQGTAVAPPPVSTKMPSPETTAGMMGDTKTGMAAAPSAITPIPAPTTIVKPIPGPMPRPRPVTVEYLIEAPLPSWDKTDNVLQVRRQLPDTATVSRFAGDAGLPKEVAGDIANVTSLNFQWKDEAGFIWNYDASGRTVSFYKESTEPDKGMETVPAARETAIMKAADDFLDAHGFGAIRKRGGRIQDYAGILPLLKNGAAKAGMPCIMMEGGGGRMGLPAAAGMSAAAGRAGGAAAAAPVKTPSTKGIKIAPSTYPSPCWWPLQLAVIYPEEHEGRKITDQYGTDVNITSLTINLQTERVANGFIQLEEKVNLSSYPLIDQETARRRLQSGGRNPVWPWGTENDSIKVRLATLELVWMRYDVWREGTGDTYYLPALRASGTITRGKGTESEEYRTLVPLLADDVFEEPISE